MCVVLYDIVGYEGDRVWLLQVDNAVKGFIAMRAAYRPVSEAALDVVETF